MTGDTAVMSVTAANAESCQWYKSIDGGKSFSPISGALYSSYTTPSVTAENDGWQYYCIVSNGAGSVQSCTFILHVKGEVSVPPTGDNSAPWLWLVIMLMSATAAALALLSPRKRKSKN